MWPLSNEARSKQFLRILEYLNGGRESMVQRVVHQISDAKIAEDITFAISISQKDIITNQLGEDITVVTEPCRRDTFPAIALATSYLAKEQKCSRDEVIVVMPATHTLKLTISMLFATWPTLSRMTQQNLSLWGSSLLIRQRNMATSYLNMIPAMF